LQRYSKRESLKLDRKGHGEHRRSECGRMQKGVVPRKASKAKSQKTKEGGKRWEDLPTRQTKKRSSTITRQEVTKEIGVLWDKGPRN